MIQARRYHPTNFMWFTWLLRHTYGLWLKRAYRITALNAELFRDLKPPFIVVGNHTTLLDPFIANAFIPYPVHWVASDGNMRNPIMRFLLIKLVGSIPKSKAIPDLETVNWIVEIIRRKKGVVGVYPEGQSSWNGTAMPAFPATAKLLKLLKAPVVMAKTMGGYLTKPRWSHVRRPGSVEISYSILFTPEQLRAMSAEEIDRVLNDALAFDDTAWCKSKGLRFESERGAESLELALHVCPACGGLATMHSRGTEFRCERCGFAAVYQPDGSFRLMREDSRQGASGSGKEELQAQAQTQTQTQTPPICEALGFKMEAVMDSVAAWDSFQQACLKQELSRRLAEGIDEPLFQDSDVTLKQGKRIDLMKTVCRGSMALYLDRLEYRDARSKRLFSFPLSTIEGEGVLKWNFFEFYEGLNVYRTVFADPAASGRKYASALGLLKSLRGAP